MSLDFDTVRGSDLVKVYGSTRALAGISVEFSAGTVTALEGPNGSGKSTLLSLLALMARPTRGEIRFGDHRRPSARALRARIGVLAHGAMVYPDLSARENLVLIARLYQLQHAQARIAAISERCGLGRWSERAARTYSRGQLQRVAIARALLHQPRLLLLDEPTTGLDARASGRLCDTIVEERERGAIIVLVTHDAALAEQLADRRLSLRRGRLAEET